LIAGTPAGRPYDVSTLPATEFVNQVRLDVINKAIETTQVPDATAVAADLGCTEAEVREAFRLLAEGHVYVLEPGDGGRLRMANPFSAVPTRFLVDAGGKRYFANCAWDALGIVAVLGGTGTVRTSCPDCGEPLDIKVDSGRLAGAEGVVHFSVPAIHSWDDIVFT
jgi:hypothetical protein